MSLLPPRPAAYRPDIDGLRALAVISVILFHAGVPGFVGGYVGVDVFFVISGYLITQLLASGTAGPPSKTLARFYVRRARRILPALLVTCAVTAAAGLLVLMPWELVYLGKNLAAAPVLLSNLAAWSDGDYFTAGLSAPLQHLWSIAVEEQFYLLYPLLLLAVSRYLPRRRRLTLIVLALASLVLCVWASHHRAAVNYFAAPTRAWELLLGAALADARAGVLRMRLAREFMAAVSLGILALVVGCYDASRISYPGAFTLVPCFATACLIDTGRNQAALVNRMLSWQPLVFVGLMSYSLYLWHQPLLVLAAHYEITPLPVAARLALLAGSFLLALGSWRFIEQPVRSRVVLTSTRSFVLAAVLASAAIATLGLILWNSTGIPQRFSPAARAFLVVPETRYPENCMARPLAQVASGDLCEFGDPSVTAPRALLWGDSHALAVLPGYEELADARHLHFYFVAKSSCWPILGVWSRARGPQSNAACASFNSAVVEAVQRLKVSIVILGGHWNDTELAAGWDLGVALHESAFLGGMRQTLLALNGSGARTVCVVLDVPTLKYAGSYALTMARQRGIPDDFLAITRDEALEPVRNMEREVRLMAQGGALRFADIKQTLCATGTCLYKVAGRSLYFDRDHLSPFGAKFVATQLESCLDPTPD